MTAKKDNIALGKLGSKGKMANGGVDAPKPRALRLEALEERQLLDASPISAALLSESSTTAILADIDPTSIPIELETATPTTWVVSSTENSATVEGSLRNVLQLASSGDTITFAPELKGATITLESALDVNRSVTIDATSLWDATNDAPGLTLDGDGTVQIANVTAAASFLGLAFANGSATSGGAIYASAALTVEDCVFTNNAATQLGGAIRAEDASLMVTNSEFTSNSSSGEGGAIKTDRCSVTLTNVDFIGNSSVYGGAAQFYQSTAFIITGGAVANNTADYEGGGFFFNGGSPTISGLTFTGNTATHGHGGAVRSYGATVTVTNATFNSNTSGNEGGAFKADNGKVDFIDVVFMNNVAGTWGGAYSEWTTEGTTITRGRFEGNRALGNGGARSISIVRRRSSTAFSQETRRRETGAASDSTAELRAL